MPLHEACIYKEKNLSGTLENHEKHESLAQKTYPHLWYTVLEFSQSL